MDRKEEAVGSTTVGESPKAKVGFSLKLKYTLAIFSLVSFIVLTLSAYFIWRESNILKEQVFTFIESEVNHLTNTAQQSIGVDELALINAIQNLKKIPYVSYSFVLDRDNNIIQYFDRRWKQVLTRKIKDKVKRSLKKTKDAATAVNTVEVEDPINKGGTLYDFHTLVLNRIDQKKIGAVIIGLSDVIIRDQVADMIKIVLLISLGFLGVSILGSLVLASITTRPINEISKGAEIIGSGNLSHRIPVKTSDELGRLAREFNIMTEKIKEAQNKEIESRVMEEQLEVARDIQEGLNPMGYYDKNGIQIKGFTRAAKGVGGDYFDYIDIDDYRVGALISDVSGKGVPASLVMVMIRTVFTSYITTGDVDCARVVRAINDSLSADFAIDKFATLFFMIYNRKTQELSFSNAGHGPLFCYRANNNNCTTTMIEGVPIGIMEDVEYQQAKVKLGPGDMIVMYTDGVTEMRNPEKEEYGLKRVYSFIMEHHTKSAQEFVDLLVEDIDIFRGDADPHDDETMLVFKREK